MNWRRLKKKLRRFYHNVVIFVILVGIFGGLGYVGYRFAKDPKGTRNAIAALFKKPRASKPTRRLTPLPPEKITEGFWRTREGVAVPGLIHARLDLAQFVRKGLLQVSGTIKANEKTERVFDGKTQTGIRFTDAGNAQLVLEFRRPQLGTAMSLGAASTHDGTFTLDCMEESESWTRSDLDQRTHCVLAQEQPYTSKRPQVVKFPHPVNTRTLRLTFHTSSADTPVALAEIELYGRVAITSVRLAATSRRLLRYEETPVELRAYDENGLQLGALGRVTWRSSTPGIVKVDEEANTIKALRPGETQIVAEVYKKPSPPITIVVHAPQAGPSGVAATPFHHSVFLQWEPPKIAEWIAYYQIYRRTPDSPFTDKPVGRAMAPQFTDRGCDAGATYIYKVETCNRDGKVIRTFEPSAPVTTSKDPKLFSEIPSLDVLVLLYSKGFSAERMELKRRGLDKAQLFYYRTSGGALLLDFTYWDIPTEPPETDARNSKKRETEFDEEPGGDTCPTMAYIAADIASRGVQQGQFDVIYATGAPLVGNWGGFALLGAAGSFGESGGVPTAVKDLREANYGLMWVFCHEFHHALDGVIIGSNPLPMYSCHFSDNFPLATPEVPLDCGTHWDGLAEILRRYPRECYENLREPYRQRVETLDADQDGFPDADPRFPMDEERFGSSPDNPDTDGDGLGDLEEFCAGNFHGTDPHNPDTDGDGVPDGEDKYPLYNRAEIIPYLPGGHKIDGVLEPSWSRYTEGIVFSHRDGIEVRIYANYDDEYLYLAIESNKRLRWFIELDGSGEDGRLSSPYRFRYSDPSDRAKALGDVWTWDSALIAYKSKLTSKGFDIEGAKVASGTRNEKCRPNLGRIIEVAIPRKLPPGSGHVYFLKRAPITEGLFLEAGKIFGLNFYFNDPDDGDNQFRGDWGCVFEIYRFVDATLTGPEDLDGDGLDALQESRRGTDPTDPDTDADGIPDARDANPAHNLLY